MKLNNRDTNEYRVPGTTSGIGCYSIQCIMSRYFLFLFWELVCKQSCMFEKTCCRHTMHSAAVSCSVSTTAATTMARQEKKTSDVWKFFDIDEGNVEKTKCKICAISLSYKGNTTKSMWNHLRSKHANAMAEKRGTIFQQYGARQTDLKSFVKVPKFSKEKHEQYYIM